MYSSSANIAYGKNCMWSSSNVGMTEAYLDTWIIRVYTIHIQRNHPIYGGPDPSASIATLIHWILADHWLPLAEFIRINAPKKNKTNYRLLSPEICFLRCWNLLESVES